MRAQTEVTVQWLLRSKEPAVRLLTQEHILGARVSEDVLGGPKVRVLMSGLVDPVHPYHKWVGAYWRMIALVDFAVPPDPFVLAGLYRVLAWRERSRPYVKYVDGCARACASMDGNALAMCCALGLAEDSRAASIVDALVSWQWPDGGWNCDRRPGARRSSFHETLPAAKGLYSYYEATGDPRAAQAAGRAVELLLSRHLFRSIRTGEVIDQAWLVPCYPPYWHYDILYALLVLARMGLANDPRAAEALDHLEGQRLPDGRWSVRRCWWNPDSRAVPPDAVDWGRSGPHEMLTLNALRVLRAAGRL